MVAAAEVDFRGWLHRLQIAVQADGALRVCVVAAGIGGQVVVVVAAENSFQVVAMGGEARNAGVW